MTTILVTGSNRGLGLEWVRQYAELGWRVYATCRAPAQARELQKLAQAYPMISANKGISIHKLDVTDTADITAITHELHDCQLDMLVNNAGVYFEQWGKDLLGAINYHDWETTLRVNTLAVMRITEALHSQIARSQRRLVLAISSHMGSITDISSANDYAYRSSKAALNAAMKGVSLELATDKIGVLLLHPGWVRTRMGGESAPLTVEESVAGMRSVADHYEASMSGGFYRYDGTQMPW